MFQISMVHVFDGPDSHGPDSVGPDFGSPDSDMEPVEIVHIGAG